jgi:hypothetical protein
VAFEATGALEIAVLAGAVGRELSATTVPPHEYESAMSPVTGDGGGVTTGV